MIEPRSCMRALAALISLQLACAANAGAAVRSTARAIPRAVGPGCASYPAQELPPLLGPRATGTGNVPAFPGYLAAGPEGSIWFTEPVLNRIGHITSSGVVIQSKPLPTPNSSPAQIVAGPEKSMWFTELNGNRIGRIATDATGTIQEFPPVRTPNSKPFGITAGSGGVWFTESAASKVAFMAVDGAIAEYSTLTPQSEPLGIAAAVDGAIWFAEYAGDKIGEFVPSTGQMLESVHPLTPRAEPNSIAQGPDGSLWFTEENANNIGNILTIDGPIAEVPIPTPHSYPYQIVGGSGYVGAGAMWFTEHAAGKIGRVAANGVQIGSISESPVQFGNPPQVGEPYGIAAGPITPTNAIGNVWFTDSAASALGWVSCKHPSKPTPL